MRGNALLHQAIGFAGVVNEQSFYFACDRDLAQIPNRPSLGRRPTARRPHYQNEYFTANCRMRGSPELWILPNAEELLELTGKL